jgi:nicotinamide-nucleotide amidase
MGGDDDAATVRLVDVFPESADVGAALRRAGLTVAVAESCTGGLLGAALTAVPGSSGYMRGGVIAYADDVKAEHLGVSRHLLATHGAVSEEVACAMAHGARVRYGADIGIAITGVAGPGDESSSKPAGLVYVAVETSSVAEFVRLEGDHGREENRSRAVHKALAMLLVVAGENAV